jgi:hypothetical protein
MKIDSKVPSQQRTITSVTFACRFEFSRDRVKILEQRHIISLRSLAREKEKEGERESSLVLENYEHAILVPRSKSMTNYFS